MKALICDRCRASDGLDNAATIVNDWGSLQLNQHNTNKHRDLCPECIASLEHFLRNPDAEYASDDIHP